MSPKNEIERIELLLENLIRIQGSLNAKINYLSQRLSQVEYTLQPSPQQDKQQQNVNEPQCLTVT